MVSGAAEIPVVVPAVLRHQGGEFVTPESCSSSPVGPYSEQLNYQLKGCLARRESLHGLSLLSIEEMVSSMQ